MKIAKANAFQSTPNLISWENGISPYDYSANKEFQSTPNLISWENAAGLSDADISKGFNPLPT